VRQPRHGTRFAKEPDTIIFGRSIWTDEFERDRSIQLRIVSAKNDPHTTASDRTHHEITANPRPFEPGQRGLRLRRGRIWAWIRVSTIEESQAGLAFECWPRAVVQGRGRTGSRAGGSALLEIRLRALGDQDSARLTGVEVEVNLLETCGRPVSIEER
jgi:hypothetical protein